MIKGFPKATKILSLAIMSLLGTLTISGASYAQGASNTLPIVYIVEFPGDCEGAALSLPSPLPVEVVPNQEPGKENKFSFKECRVICQSMANCTGFSFSTAAKKSDMDDICNLKNVKNHYCSAGERIVNGTNYYSKINILANGAPAAPAPVAPTATAPEVVPAPAPAPEVLPAPAAAPEVLPAPAPEQAPPAADAASVDTQQAPQDPATVAVEPDPV